MIVWNEKQNKKNMTMKNSCKNCIHWKNHQRLLNYHETAGFCLNGRFHFNTNDGRMIGVVDTQNLRNQSEVTGHPAHDVETLKENQFDVNFSRYLLATEEDFGCKFFEQRK